MSTTITYWRAWWIIKKKRLIDLYSLKKRSDYTKFIILSSGRCGSTLLHTYLNSHPSILSKGEILRELYDGDGPNAPKEVDDIIFKPQGNHIKSVGLKLFYDYRDMNNFKNAFQAIAKDQSIKVIHLVREDKLAQFVSYKRAWRDLEWSANPENANYGTKLTVDVQEYTDFVNENKQYRTEALVSFQAHDFIELTYEQLSNDAEKYLKNIQEFLEVPEARLFTALSKQSNRPLKEVVDNWDDVRDIIV